MAVTSSPSFVGREDALGTVRAALDRGPAMVLIEGEPGIGKTRLLHEALAGLPEHTAMSAMCLPLREPFPLGPVVDGLHRLRPELGDVELSPLGGALRPLLPEWADRLPPGLDRLDDPTATRHRLFRALAELVERLGVDVLVVEDAHWADAATLEWLLTLCSADDRSMSLVMTYRPHDVTDQPPLLRLTSRATPRWSQVRIELGPLDVDETRQLVGSMLGTTEVSEQFASFLRHHTDGVPLALEETIRLMRERHDIIRQGGGWTRRLLDELEVPPTVRDSVLERLERLDPAARQILRAAAVVAEPADEPLLVAVADLSEEAGRSGIVTALAAGLLRESGGGRLGFRHVLDAKAVQEVTPVTVQWSMHRRAAEYLERLDPQPVVRLSRHFREARDIEAWCRYAEASANVAWESGDDRVAVVTILDVLTSIEHPIERRVRLAHKLGDLAFFGAANLGELAERVVATLRHVLDLVDLPPRERGELRLQFGRMLWRVGRELEAFEEMEASVPDLGHRPDLAARAMANLAVPLAPDWPAERHLRWLDRATQLVDRVGSELDRLAVAVNRATTWLLLGEEAGWEAIADITESGTDSGEQRLIALGLMNVAEATMVWGRYDDARKQLDIAADYIRKIHYERFENTKRVVGAQLDWYNGAWKGLRDAGAELADSDDTGPSYRLRARQLVGLLDLASSGPAAEYHLMEIVDEWARRGVAEPESVLAPAALARLQLAESGCEEALKVTTPVVDMIARKDVWLWATDIAAVHVEALLEAGRRPEAASLITDFAAGIAARHAPAPAAALLVCRGLEAAATANPGAAASNFAEAAAAYGAMCRPHDELLALERQGRSLLTAGHDGGVNILTDVEQRLRDLGATWDADRAAQTLRQHGIDVVRTWRRGPRGYGDELSPRELACVELVAHGMTNKRVAEALFLSPRTVESHLRNAMRKLNVTSRTALTVAAVGAGLVSSPHRGG